MINRKMLCAATLACLAPFAAAAQDGYLTPGKNGGSGQMPSGYSQLYFELSNGDWAGKLSLPARPKAGDRVTLSSLADTYALLDGRQTVFADQVYIPVDSLSNAEFRWSAKHARWDVIGGLSARVVYGQNRDVLNVPSTEHTVTQVSLYDTKRANTVSLPSWAPNGAVLVVANASSANVGVQGGPGNGTCSAGSNCGYVYGADGAWHVRLGHGQERIAAQLPTPDKRFTDVFVGNPAQDPLLPQVVHLPSEAVCGDIYQFTNTHDATFSRVSSDNTSLNKDAVIKKGLKYVFRFDGARGRWIHQGAR
ncbi:hypothetical protein [Stenotrophomonas beteli]|uniref:Metalloprotease StcE beta-sandwich domain-containing protein n=1 Tax=Stenotrophomonas beteli TaxID=3384461 RepID=A0A0R0BGM4_9GAMM|nr:hypothetical protein [Stenotrophomonas maltophilia]KRG52532.1 hypothetical protein ARC23_05220 [Stenotrophomonas maltophilia]